MSIIRGNYDENGIGTTNQCTMTIRTDGSEIEIPINFGLTSEEIRGIYPYLLSIANRKVENPAIMFTNLAKKGQFDGLSDDVYGKLLATVERQSRLWYNKPEASILDLAMRIAVDITMDPNHWMEHFTVGTDIDNQTGEIKVEDGGLTNLVSEKEREEVDEIVRSVVGEDDEEVIDPTYSDREYEQPSMAFNVYGKWADGAFDDEEDIEAKQWSDEGMDDDIVADGDKEESLQEQIEEPDMMADYDIPVEDDIPIMDEEEFLNMPIVDDDEPVTEDVLPEGITEEPDEGSDAISDMYENIPDDEDVLDDTGADGEEDPITAVKREIEAQQALYRGGMAGLDTLLKENDEYSTDEIEQMQFINEEYNGDMEDIPTLDEIIDSYLDSLPDEELVSPEPVQEDVPGDDVFDDDFEGDLVEGDDW